MPVVPIAENRVGIADVTDAKLRPADLSGTGLQALGSGLQAAGQGGEEFAKAQFEHQRDLETAGAKMLDTGLMRSVLDGGEQFKGLTGTAAANGLDPYLKNLEALGNATLEQATSPHMRQLIAPVVAERIATARVNAMAHARQQSSVALSEATTARVGASKSAALHAETDSEFETNVATGMADVQHYWDGQNLDPIVGKQKAQEWASGVLLGRAGNLMDTNRVDEAQAFIAKHRDSFTGDDLDKVTGALAPIVRDRMLEGKADAILGTANPDGSAANFVDPVRGADRPPVAGGQFGASRDYGSHKGIDRPAAAGTPVYSGHGPGTATVSHSDLGGNIVTIRHDDGYTTRYMHLGKVAVASGTRVDATTPLGQVGMTGRSTGAHLHYEVLAPDGKAIDPTHLEAQVRQGPTRENLDTQLAAVDRDQSLTPEDRTALKAKIMARVGINDHLRERQFQDADEAASQWLLQQKPGSFTSVTQMPANIRATLRPSSLLQYQTSAEANQRALSSPPAANGPVVTLLHQLQYADTTKFAQTNLEMYRGQMSAGEFDSLATEQAKIRAQPKEGAKYSDIFSTIRNYGAVVLGPPPKLPAVDANKPAAPNAAYQDWERNRLALADHMRKYVERLQRFDPNFKPTDDTYRKAYEDATLRVAQPDGSFQYRYKIGSPRSVSISQADEQRIRTQLKAQGMRATPDDIMRVYLTAAVRP